ncbi:uncharacterized protein [Cherax quadricarinatus]|uniref:uncharacterized protein n=1 Tax=Cherax quadricarinatus TaxID=27406 RepID=UPI00387E7D76
MSLKLTHVIKRMEHGGCLVLLTMLCSCFPAQAAVVNPNVTADTCVLLGDEDLTSHYVYLPTNIVVKPLSTQWRLDLTFNEDRQKPLVCVRLVLKEEKIQLGLYTEKCEDENIKDFNLWKSQYVRPHEWTMINISVTGHITLAVDKGDPINLLSPVPVSKHGFVYVSQKHSVDIALGCQVNCPACRASKPSGNKLSTIAELKTTTEKFFLKVGREFTRLNFEIMCETQLGQEVFVGNTDINPTDIEELTPLKQWHKISLEYYDTEDTYIIAIDYRRARKESTGLKACSVFKKFFVRAAGETLYSYDCDPTSGEIHIESPDETHPKMNQESSVAGAVGVAVVCTIALIGVISLLLYLAGYRIKHEAINQVCRKCTSSNET